MCADFAASFFDYDGVEVRERAGDLEFLAGRSQSEWAKVLAVTETRRFSRGETIISRGESERSLYLLMQGTLGVRLGSEHDRTFKTIEAPSVVGEVAFLDGLPRSASLFAISDGELERLRMESFEVLAAREPELGRAILLDLARIVTQRLRMASDVIAAGGS